MKNSEILSNGVRLINHQLNHLHSITLSLSFKAGSAYENNTNRGITHLVEHLFFRKLNDWSQEKLYYEMQKIGTEVRGSTSYDYVSFKITVVPKFFLQSLKILIKFLEDFKWNDKEISQEKKVVLNQIDNIYNNPYGNNYYIGTGYEFPIMGNHESVSSLDKDSINLWKKKYFNCNNSCVVITGNFSDEQLFECKNLFSQVKNNGKYQDFINSVPENFNHRNSENRYTFYSVDSEISNIDIYFDVNKKYSYELTRMLASILGEGCGSKLSYNLREKYGYTDDVFTELTCMYDFSRLSFSFEVNSAVLIDSLNLFFTVLNEFKTKISQEEFDTSITFFTENQLMDLDNTKNLNSNYVLCDFILDSILSNPIEQKERYEKITIDELQNYAREILTPCNLSLVLVTNLDKTQMISKIENLIY